MTEQTNTQQRTAVGSNGPGVASLVLGILGLVVALIEPGVVASTLGVVGLAFGLAGAVRSRDLTGAGRGTWIAGLAVSVLALVVPFL